MSRRTVIRSEAEERRELAADLSATWEPSSLASTVSSWVSRPSILRRLADALAAAVIDDVDRIVAVGPAAPVLASAVGLATGLPFHTDGPGEALGEIHAGERVCIVSTTSLEAADAIVGNADVIVVQRLNVVAAHRKAEHDGEASLFTIGDDDTLLLS